MTNKARASFNLVLLWLCAAMITLYLYSKPVLLVISHGRPPARSYLVAVLTSIEKKTIKINLVVLFVKVHQNDELLVIAMIEFLFDLWLVTSTARQVLPGHCPNIYWKVYCLICIWIFSGMF